MGQTVQVKLLQGEHVGSIRIENFLALALEAPSPQAVTQVRRPKNAVRPTDHLNGASSCSWLRAHGDHTGILAVASCTVPVWRREGFAPQGQP